MQDRTDRGKFLHILSFLIHTVCFRHLNTNFIKNILLRRFTSPFQKSILKERFDSGGVKNLILVTVLVFIVDTIFSFLHI